MLCRSSAIFGATPAPLRATLTGEPAASWATVSDPLAAASAVGTKATLTVQLEPGCTGATAQPSLETANGPVTLDGCTTSCLLPLFETVTSFSLDVVPTRTLPKARLAGDTDATGLRGAIP